MNQHQWQEVEAIVRREQQRTLQQYDTKQYNELSTILNHLYKLAHG